MLEKLFLTSVTVSLVVLVLFKPLGEFRGKWYQFLIAIVGAISLPMVVILGLILIWAS
jgi:hypothetical protein